MIIIGNDRILTYMVKLIFQSSNATPFRAEKKSPLFWNYHVETFSYFEAC